MSDEQPGTVNEQSPNGNTKKRNHLILKIILILLTMGLATFFYWFFVLRFQQSTDNAYVDGNAVMLMSPQDGIVVAIYADNTQYVEQGQLLVELDTILYQLTFNKAQVDLALAARQVKQMWEDVQQRKADVLLREAEVTRTQQDYDNRYGLKGTQAISKEDLTHAEADLAVSKANLNLAQHQLDSAKASLGSPPYEQQPIIQNAKIALRNAYIQLQRCEILAPVSGIVAQRTVQVGEFITTARTLMSIIPTDQIWINANFKETQLSPLRIGQPVRIKSDVYGSKAIFNGKVQGIVAGTGSVFSLIPPQNATGNWIKIVQRVPVRISLDPEELKKHPLFLGLSNYVTIDIRNQEGLRLSDHPIFTPRFSTPVFDVSMRPVDDLIEKILKHNLNIPQEAQ